MTAGYSGTPLDRKLGVARAERLLIVDPPPGFVGGLLTMPPGVRVGDLRMRRADLIITFVARRTRLAALVHSVVPRLTADGAWWVAWPKRSSGVASDVTEDVVREVVLPSGLVDVKVAAIDDTWSGLRCVVRRELRQDWGRE